MIKATNLFAISFLVLLGCVNTQDQTEAADKSARQGKYPQAIAILDGVLQSDPGDIDALLDRGVYHTELEHYHLALKDFSAVLSIDNRNILALYNRALMYIRLKRSKDAMNDLTAAIQLKGGKLVWTDSGETGPENPYDVAMKELRYERAVLLYDTDQLQEAFSDFSFCIESNHMVPESYYYRGIIYLSYDDKEHGCSDLTMAKAYGDSYADSVMMNYCQ